MNELTREQIRQQQQAMQAQIAALEDEVRRTTEQLVMSRGALQMLNHLLSLLDPDQKESEAGDG